MLKKSLIICFLCVSLAAYAQKTRRLDSLNATQVIDTLLIDRDINNWSIRLFTNYKGQSFNLVDSDDKLSFKPNSSPGIGVGLGTSKAIIDIAINLSGERENPTKRFDMQGAVIVGDHNLVGLYVQHYSGFNVENNFGKPEFFRDDIESFSMGLNYLYTFEKLSFSRATLRAGLIKEEKKHFITFGVGGFMVYDKFSGDDTVVPIESDFDENKQLNKFKGLGLGVSAGVISVFVLPANFFINLDITPGIGLMSKSAYNDSGKQKVDNPLLYKLDYNAGVGYAYKRFYVTLTYGNGLYTTRLNDGLNYLFGNTKAKISFGYRINSNKKLKLPFEKSK
ncbi:DUF4421 family protein [Tamlana sp. 2_MG-2023]|uniref:DUF4421 family protein n=1 Tax=unclassified Tamlana TaxID=2614803 RepID=UPI0026E3BA62|nr:MULTISPECIES: DUF4421 family protein [unclassified Tamlana]MDO6760396.1 DUF4421 family protein [Tamlana sp. 2_MG-2023]MDO6789905.1 DUF4421 family protein [Tamlana sp. 1_MG-2023]